MASCPQCTSQKVWKDGLRTTSEGDVQRFVCRKCGYRFSDKTLNTAFEHRFHCQIGAKPRPRLVENLVTVEPLREGPLREATCYKADIKGRIVEFAWWLKKNGYANTTIRVNTTVLRVLSERGANLQEPESVKDAIANQEWSNARRHTAITAFSLYLKMQGKTWQPPICKVTRKLPFIPEKKKLMR